MTFVFPPNTFLLGHTCKKTKRRLDCITVLTFIYICIYIQYTRKGDSDDVVIIRVGNVIFVSLFLNE